MGNSLLIVSDQVGVSIAVADQANGANKSVYDLDAGERTASFTVQPTCSILSANEGSHVNGIKDDLTISVTLPADLHFNETGVSLTPTEVTVNTDGTTTVVWQITDVTAGEAIDPIVFSVTIGEEGTVNDVSNNESFTAEATVTSKNDARAATAENGNYSETSISVIKLAASAVTKRVLTPLVEAGAEIGYRLRYSNLSETPAENVVVYDILPYQGDGVGSDFSGAYQVTKIEVDYSAASQTFVHSLSSLDAGVTWDIFARQDTVRDALLSGGDPGIAFETLSRTENGHFISFSSDLNGCLSTEDATAVILELGTVYGNEYLDIYVYIQPADEGSLIPDGEGETQQPEDVYSNRFYQNADNQAATVISNVVSAAVVNREVSGCVWIDSNRDGIRTGEEQLYNGAAVELYRTEPSGFDLSSEPVLEVDGVSLYSAYTALGEQVDPVVTDDAGAYLFTCLEGGSYVVVIGDVDSYYLTTPDVGEDDTVNSDAVEADGYNVIQDIKLPALENMVEAYYASTNHDAGLVRRTRVEIQKTDTEGNLLAGAKLALYESDDVVDGEPAEGSTPIAQWTSSDSEAYILENELLAGREYVLMETEAPFGYTLAEPVVFTLQDSSETQTIRMTNAFQTSSILLQKYDSDRLTPLEGVTFALTFVEAEQSASAEGYLLKEGESISGTTNEEGEILFENLNRGTYRIVETSTVNGHSLLAKEITVTLPIKIAEDELEEYGQVDTSKGVLYNGFWYFFDCTYAITNDAVFSLPQAGTEGHWGYGYLGFGIAVCAGVVLFAVLRRKKA